MKWRKEPDSRIEGSRGLDQDKVQAPGVVCDPSGLYRLFYTAVGPEKPFSDCQGYILSALSEDGFSFEVDPGIRVVPDPQIPHMALRVLAPTITTVNDRWRMYFEARGSADRPTVICSAISEDMLNWELEPGIRVEKEGGVRAPRYLRNSDGGGRLFFCATEYGSDENGKCIVQTQGVVSAKTGNGLDFEIESGYRLQSMQAEHDSCGFSAAEVIEMGSEETMLVSAWQDVPTGTDVPLHPSQDPDAVRRGASADFAAASIASDLAGYRSRIYTAHTDDGLVWKCGNCAVEGDGYGGCELDAVHAEDMSLIRLEDGRYRMYYAGCDIDGNWRVLSAISE